jgi:hypothetical protein
LKRKNIKIVIMITIMIARFNKITNNILILIKKTLIIKIQKNKLLIKMKVYLSKIKTINHLN